MNTFFYPHLVLRRVFWPISLLLLGLLAGCTATRNDTWNSRVGSYGVKQALLDLGQPEKATMMPDGTQVGVWLIRSGTRSSLFNHWGPTFSGRSFDYTFLPRDAPQVPDEYLRLLFAPDGKLVAWDHKFS
ncbi:MAG: hypothetical protein JWQ71_191 [Pedosphaera sp.]|nr:hypothetical protein [Pedosphaera sp.]